MNFYELYKTVSAEKLRFFYSEIQIEIEEDVLSEWEFTPSTTANLDLKRFKVKFRLPKSKTAASHGHYTDETTFVFAANAQQAKEQVLAWLRRKIEPTPEKPKRVNYLAAIQSKHMNLRTKEIVNWNDFVELLNFVASQNRIKIPNPLTYFGPQEYQILLSRLQTDKNFISNIKELPRRSQGLLKKLYFQIQPRNIPNQGTIDFAMRTMGKKKYAQEELWQEPVPEKPKKKPLPKVWRYDSVFAPKRAGERLEQGSTFQEIVKEAKKYGIPFSVLKTTKENMFDASLKTIKIKREIYDSVKQKLANVYYKIADTYRQIANRAIRKKALEEHIKYIERTTGSKVIRPPFSSNDRAFHELDSASIYKWDTISHEAYTEKGAEYFGYETDKTYEDEAKTDYEQTIYDLFKDGRPMPPSANEMYRNALDKLLDLRDKEIEEEKVPF